MSDLPEPVITYEEAIRRKCEYRVLPGFMGKMMKISTLISWAQDIKDRFGDTCVYTPDLSWGAVALNREAADKKRLLVEGSSWVADPEFAGTPDELASLRAQVRKLREALKPFAKLADDLDCEASMVEISRPCPENPSPHIIPTLTEYFRNARAALKENTDAG